MKRSRIDEVRLAEGLRWNKQEAWFGERVDPAFVEKRGEIEQLYTAPQAGSVVVDLDEMGPEAAKSFAGQQFIDATARPATQPNRSSIMVGAARATTSGRFSQRRARR